MEKIIEHGERISILIFDTCFDFAGFLNIIPFSRIPPQLIPQPEEEEIVEGIELGDVKLEEIETNEEIIETEENTEEFKTEEEETDEDVKMGEVERKENLEDVKVKTEDEPPTAPKFTTTRYKKQKATWRLFMFYSMVVTELAQLCFIVWRFKQSFARSPNLNSELVIQGLYMEFHIASGLFGLNLILYQDELVRLLNQIQELIVHFKGRKVFSNFLIKFSLKII